jgi:hypothetical protein
MNTTNETVSLKKRFRRNRWKYIFSDVLLWIILLIFFIRLRIILTSIRIALKPTHSSGLDPNGYPDSPRSCLECPPGRRFGLGGEIL